MDLGIYSFAETNLDSTGASAAQRSQAGSLLVGSAQEVIDKILLEHELFAHDRFLAQMSVGPMPHAKIMRSIELFGTLVAPVVRRETARSETASGV